MAYAHIVYRDGVCAGSTGSMHTVFRIAAALDLEGSATLEDRFGDANEFPLLRGTAAEGNFHERLRHRIRSVAAQKLEVLVVDQWSDPDRNIELARIDLKHVADPAFRVQSLLWEREERRLRGESVPEPEVDASALRRELRKTYAEGGRSVTAEAYLAHLRMMEDASCPNSPLIPTGPRGPAEILLELPDLASRKFLELASRVEALRAAPTFGRR